MKCNNPWNEISTPEKNANTRRIDSKHPLDLFWGRDTNGNYLFLFFFEDSNNLANTKFPELNGIELLFGKSQQPGKIQLSLILKERVNWELFFALCNDVVQATFNQNDPSKAVAIVLRRLNRWREFLKMKRPSILTEETIKGLIGELLFIKNHLASAFTIGNAITFWQGPEGTPQDFNVRQSAFEVKCQIGATNPSVKISSVEQLWPQLPEMFLYVVTLGKCPKEDRNAITLPSLTHQIRKWLEESGDSLHIEKFNDLLFLTGYIDSEAYNEYSYLFSEEQMYKVEGEFPRIPVDSLQRGICKLSYSILLRECEPFKEWPDWIERN